MTPYYSDALVTIYHGDALDEAVAADVLVTDPPLTLARCQMWTATSGTALALLLGSLLSPLYTGRSIETKRCIWEPCVATWRHWHGGFPAGYDNPDDPTGPPIPFEGDDPEPNAVRDYNGGAFIESGG